MKDVNSKTLHEKNGKILDRARQGERFRVLREGRTDAFLVPAADSVDPEWTEIMAEVWKEQKTPGATRPNPVLKERKARKHAARLR
jgi:antitoxin (DNA-binding transcriptional repressor) of toxin-antitoxin stability system